MGSGKDGGLPPWLAPLAPLLFGHVGGEQQKGAEGAPAAPPAQAQAAPAGHGRLPQGVDDSIPWYRPFFWSPTTEKEGQEALAATLPLIGCAASPSCQGQCFVRGGRARAARPLRGAGRGAAAWHRALHCLPRLRAAGAGVRASGTRAARFEAV
jgi:hypothetical protein